MLVKVVGPRLVERYRAERDKRLRADANEVEEIFEVPLAFLLDSANHQRQSREWQGSLRWFYAIPYEGHYIWGATAGMLVNLARHLSQGSSRAR